MADKISDVMTPNPATCEPDDTVREAATAMKEGDFGAVVVCENDDVRGILTDRDIVIRVVAERQDPSTAKVRDAYTTDPTTLSPDAGIDDAVAAMREADVRRLPVVEGSKVVGIVSIGDLAVARDEKSALAD